MLGKVDRHHQIARLGRIIVDDQGGQFAPLAYGLHMQIGRGTSAGNFFIPHAAEQLVDKVGSTRQSELEKKW